MKKIISIILASVMCLSLMAGCGKSNQGAGTDTGKEAELKLYLFAWSREYEDSKSVFAEINKLLKEKINATIDYTFDMVDDATRKIPLIMASGEYYDGISMPNDVFKQEVQKGALMEIGDLLNKYMPKRMESITDYDYADISFDGKVYGVPGGFQWFTPQGYLLRGDLRKKYGIPEVKDLAGLQLYMDTLMKNEPGIIPFNTSAADNTNLILNFLGAKGFPSIGNDLWYHMEDEKPTLSYSYEIPEYREYLEKTMEFRDKGYWSRNAYAGTSISRDAFAAGSSFVGMTHAVNANDTAISLRNNHPDWEVEFFMIPDKTNRRPSGGRSVTIPRVSKNPERLLMALELLSTDSDINSLLMYGIEDVHYTISSDGSIVNTAEGAKYPIDSFPLAWSSRNLSLMKPVSGGINGIMDIQNKVDELSVIHKHAGFILNTGSIATEIAAVSNVLATMKGKVNLGAFDSADEVLREFESGMNAAGADKLKTEAQKQFDEFLANKK